MFAWSRLHVRPNRSGRRHKRNGARLGGSSRMTAAGARLAVVVFLAEASPACVSTSAHEGDAEKRACVEIPSIFEDVIVTTKPHPRPGEAAPRTISWNLVTEHLFDVDGDGQLDAFVPALDETACPERAHYRVLVVRGICGIDFGTVGPGRPTITRAASADYALITTVSETSSSGSSPGPTLQRTSRVWQVSAGRYRVIDERVTDSECYHCPTWSCRRVDPAQ